MVSLESNAFTPTVQTQDAVFSFFFFFLKKKKFFLIFIFNFLKFLIFFYNCKVKFRTYFINTIIDFCTSYYPKKVMILRLDVNNNQNIKMFAKNRNLHLTFFNL